MERIAIVIVLEFSCDGQCQHPLLACQLELDTYDLWGLMGYWMKNGSCGDSVYCKYKDAYKQHNLEITTKCAKHQRHPRTRIKSRHRMTRRKHFGTSVSSRIDHNRPSVTAANFSISLVGLFLFRKHFFLFCSFIKDSMFNF